MYEQKLFKHYKEVHPKDWIWPNFTPKEIACKGTHRLLIDKKAMDALQVLRTALGVPFSPNSAYRTPEHNAAIRGARNSYHVKGRAFDIPIKKGMTRAMIHEAARKAGFKGIGDYNTFVHVDTRDAATYFDRRK
jgi:zinc D-Ala-D-Ala carboxypeptidase